MGGSTGMAPTVERITALTSKCPRPSSVASIARVTAPPQAAAVALLGASQSLGALTAALQAAGADAEHRLAMGGVKQFLKVYLPSAEQVASSITSLLDCCSLEWDIFLEHAGEVQKQAKRLDLGATRMAAELGHWEERYLASSLAAGGGALPAAMPAAPKRRLPGTTAAVAHGLASVAAVGIVLVFAKERLPSLLAAGGLIVAQLAFRWWRAAHARRRLQHVQAEGQAAAQQQSKEQAEVQLQVQPVVVRRSMMMPTEVLSSCQQLKAGLQQLTVFSGWAREALQLAGESNGIATSSSTALLRAAEDGSQLKSFWLEAREAAPDLRHACGTFFVATDRALSWARKE